MARFGLHKQVANRVIEPFQHIAVIVTATDFANWFTLRRHHAADPTVAALTDAMWQAYSASTPRLLRPGQWHLPYIVDHDFDRAEVHTRLTMPEVMDDPDGLAKAALKTLLRCSAARCARVSYHNHDGSEPNVAKDLETYRKLDAHPLHGSPMEHQATPDVQHDYKPYGLQWAAPHLHGNFDGGIQHRKLLPNERATSYDPREYDSMKEAA